MSYDTTHVTSFPGTDIKAFFLSSGVISQTSAGSLYGNITPYSLRARTQTREPVTGAQVEDKKPGYHRQLVGGVLVRSHTSAIGSICGLVVLHRFG